MVLFKDLNEKAVNVLDKNLGHEKPCEIEYRHASKDLVVDNNVCLKSITGQLDTWNSVKYLTPTTVTEVKLTGSGNATVDAKWLHGNLSVGCKAEGKPSKGGDGTAFSCDLNGEVKCTPLHMKLSYLPFSRSCSLSALSSQELKCGTVHFGGEVTTDRNIFDSNYAIGGAFAFRETSKTQGGPASKGLWVASVKSAPHGDSKLGKVIGQLHVDRESSRIPAQYAAEVQHIIADRNTNLTMSGQFYLNKQKDTTLRVRVTHDLKNVVVSVGQKLGPVKATLGAEFVSNKLGSISIARYGMKLNMVNNAK